jgi:6-phosphogluconolactonase
VQVPHVPNSTVRIVDDVPSAFASVAAEVVDSATKDPPHGTSSARCSLVLSGGPTARRCYEHLAALELDWSAVDIYLGDERCVAPDDPDSNELLVRQSLVSQVRPPPHLRPMSCEQGPAIYHQLLAGVAEVTGGLDLVHLGLGPDGHTASLFAGSQGLEAPETLPGTRGAPLVARNDDPGGTHPHQRLTLTLAGIALARLVVFTVAGVEKRDAFARVLGGDDLPATRVRADKVLWLVDREALGDAGSTSP